MKPETTKKTYNQIALAWKNLHSQDTWGNEGRSEFIRLLKKGDHILDVGCGTGLYSNYLVTHGLKVTGFDFAENMVALAKKTVPAADFKIWDIYDIDKFPGTYDGIFANAVFLHIPKKDLPFLLGKTAAKLKKGGYIYISVKERRIDQPEEILVKDTKYEIQCERFFSLYRMDELKKYVTDEGLKTVYEHLDANPDWKNNWLILIAKK
jgi:cyclopropane fatty-acyl-phospholipid synthase-like methyltransferase